MGGARKTALTALERCRRADAWPDAVLGHVMNAARLPVKDRGLATALCYGVLQNRTLLDYNLQRFSNKKVAGLEPKVLDILRISAYQLMFLTRIGRPVVVNEAVELCRALGYDRATGYVNAVLRRLSADPAIPEIPGPVEKRLSIRYSHPVWLVNDLLDRLGEAEAEALLARDNAPAPVAIQANTLKTDADALRAALEREGLSVEAHPTVPDCLTLELAGGLLRSEPFKNGWFYVQDAAAKCAALAAEPEPGQTILDACAAPGGKSFAAAIASGGEAGITANDVHERKLKRIREGAERLGLTLETTAFDAREPRPDWDAAYDAVLADVPCSGLGVIRKKPDVRWKDPSAFPVLEEHQRSLLDNLAGCVRPGGVLLYSTCTFRKEENGDMVRRFLSEHADFAPEDFQLPLPAAESENGCLQLWPQRHGTDGFFIAKLRKRK